MTIQPTFPGLFAPVAPVQPVQQNLPLEPRKSATGKQVSYARTLAMKTGVPVPKGIESDRAALSQWIDQQKTAPRGGFGAYPSSKQVAFAERIARLRRAEIPPECFRDRTLMSRWIDSNKPR